ncbi:YesL family protein [Fictibacillus barbaricus]|uniref:Membrane protein YesL n=1 Tax=Fictibacillus barbaricus TaxID=182136 RepID=A0ABU1U1P1_9BACL|nr:DUF624 domain-containing protein [Fictibacillus barbaricus]MDR7073291.1 putative membrane protein YesL [Fictibacillus barbaricus]
MEGTRYIGKIFSLCEWIARLAYLNILWILFTCAGLILFGLVPATTAMFAVTRKWVLGNSDIKIFTTFWKIYRKEFIQVQPFGLLLILIGFVFWIDYQFYMEGNATVFLPVKLFLVGLFVLYVLFLFFMFPVYVHYEFKPFQYVKNVLLIVVSYPLQCILMICGSVFMFLFVINFSGIALFLGGSSLAFWITLISHQVFAKMEQKIKHSGADHI